MRSKVGRFAIGLAGLGLMLLFQNFTYDKDSDVKSAIFPQAGQEQTALKRSVELMHGDSARLNNLAQQASGYADFVGVEDVRHMSDAQILSRVSDSMFTSIEVMKMENSNAAKTQGVENVARSLEKDARLQRMVITAVRENANKLR